MYNRAHKQAPITTTKLKSKLKNAYHNCSLTQFVYKELDNELTNLNEYFV